MKRIYYLLGVIGAITIVVLIGYFLRYRAQEPAAPVGGNAFTGGLPGATTGGGGGTAGGTAGGQSQQPPGVGQTPAVSAGQKFGIISQNTAVNFYVDGQNNVILIRPAGQVLKVAGGNVTVLSSSEVANPIRTEFSYDGKKILAVFGNPSNPQASVFDVDGKSWQPLPQGLLGATWSPTDYRLAYFLEKNGAKSLITFDTSNSKSKPEELAALHVEDVTLNWLRLAQMIISDKGGADFVGSVWSFDAKAKTLSQLVAGRNGLESLWSGDAGMGLVFGASVNGNSNLDLINLTGNHLTSLTIKTLPSKCVFQTVEIPAPAAGTSAAKTKTPAKITAKSFLYCAIPRDQRQLRVSTLPDDYNQKSLFTTDDFYRVDLANGNISSVFSNPAQNLDATKLKIFNDNLFFVNRYDQKIYAVSLK